MKPRPRKWLGTILFFLSLPGLYVYLRLEERTRVVITVGDEVLMLKGWYGSNRWMLPGGGAHAGESPLVAAVREVYEETGIQLQARDLQFLSSGVQWDSFGLRFTCHNFGVSLPKKPQVRVDNHEIIQSAWLPIKHVIRDGRSVHKVSVRAVAAWSDTQNLV